MEILFHTIVKDVSRRTAANSITLIKECKHTNNVSISMIFIYIEEKRKFTSPNI